MFYHLALVVISLTNLYEDELRCTLNLSLGELQSLLRAKMIDLFIVYSYLY
ncbi:unnamed protein product [Moneuplotes crassus]|uniref:Uncharacterized protein n=1 Tax=Euplotes crassus TaxID=5936 RepID=A0AAD2DC55_EUPCR|nr:unnamed protein product [Moneuplotes crassus]